MSDKPKSSTSQALHVSADELPWAELMGRLVRGLETSHRQWTVAKKKDSLQRVLQSSKQNNIKLHERLQQLTQSWDSQATDDVGIETADTGITSSTAPAVVHKPVDEAAVHSDWVANMLLGTVDSALPVQDSAAAQVRQHLHATVDATWVALRHATPAQVPEVQQALEMACAQSQRVIAHRQHFTDQLVSLCQVLTDSMKDLVDDDSWIQGQCIAVQSELSQGLNYRGTRRIEQLVDETRRKQKHLLQERKTAQQALKDLIHEMLQELVQLDVATGQFQDKLGSFATTIGQADTLESLTGVVRAMVHDSKAIHDVVSHTKERLATEHSRASQLTNRVQELEQEIRKLSDEVSTDPLTQIANRRGLMQSFTTKRAQTQDSDQALSIGLLDVDNFKKLNDTLGHQTGDEALKFLAKRVSQCLRPNDSVARYGGEEFVVLLPNTDATEGEQILTRLQRQLSAECFEHDNQRVFITFSAGVTTHRLGEPIEAALDRADMALYEAKRTGKNRTCVA